MVTRCAKSKNFLPPPSALSTLDTCADLAASWAARSLRTLSSGDSPPLRGERAPGLGPLPAAVAAAVLEDSFEEAWGVVDVNRVASDALLAATRVAIVGVGGIG